ncbi:hypothetical protein EIP91_001247 [Steccherinum ochraceum]|uniref:Ecp2 effector protein domain-containing protein n=1 Tax=Steccherinum ochraceum TaxID=92696 RepID=A0A4V2MWK0_9APHY|nr:hypothetical protein EIP91_001247 [Steccherinum ochraceum]
MSVVQRTSWYTDLYIDTSCSEGSVTCANFNPANPHPSVGDCDNLISILRSFQNTIGPTFIQGTGFPNPIIVDFSTCRVSFGNTRTDGSLIEYCWDALADNANSVLNGCIAPGIQPAGECSANNGQWAMATSGLNRNS